MTGLGTDITLNDMFEFYIAHKKHKGKKLTDNTVYNYRSMYKLYVENSILGNMKISDIKRININYFYEHHGFPLFRFGAVMVVDSTKYLKLMWVVDGCPYSQYAAFVIHLDTVGFEL